MENNFVVLFSCTTLLIIVSIFGSLAFKNGGSRTCALGVIATAVSFGVTPWIALWNRDDGTLPIGGMPVILTYVGIALFCGSVLLVGRYLGRLPSDRLILKNENMFNYALNVSIMHRYQNNLNLIAIVLVPLTLRIALYLLYSHVPTSVQMTAQASAGIMNKSVPYAITITGQFITFIEYGLFLWASVKLFSPSSCRFDRVLALIILLESVPFVFIEGRRIIIEHALLFYLGYHFSHRFNFNIKLIAAIVAFVLIFHNLAAPVFLVFRTNYIDEQRRTDSAEAALLFAVTSVLEETELFHRAEQMRKENLSQRPLIMRFNSNICDAQMIGRPWLYGAAMWSSIATSVPRFIVRSKDDIVPSEILISRHFGLDDPEVDTSSNLPAYGMADFGLFGCALYGCLWGLSLIFLERLAWLSADRHPFFTLATLGTALHVALSIESDSVLIWVSLRNTLAIFLLLEFYRIWKKPTPA